MTIKHDALDHTGTPLPPDSLKCVHDEARTVGKRAIGILLQCLLAVLSVHDTNISSISSNGSSKNCHAWCECHKI